MTGWTYYNHAMIPTTMPHEEPDLTPLHTGELWNIHGGGTPLFVRWTSDFDCGYETNWWYVIKDNPFDIASLKSKRRYEINKGKRNFTVKRINPMDYQDEILEVTKSAYSSWPEKYRPMVDEKQFRQGLIAWEDHVVYGGFEKDEGRLCAYSYLTECSDYLEFSVLRVCPESENKGINAAMVAAVVEDYNDRLGKNFYINDGARSIFHETNFQDYLEKYFGFRKAYCKLHIAYNPKIRWIIKLIYPFRLLLQKFDRIRLVHQINSVLNMEEIVRSEK